MYVSICHFCTCSCHFPSTSKPSQTIAEGPMGCRTGIRCETCVKLLQITATLGWRPTVTPKPEVSEAVSSRPQLGLYYSTTLSLESRALGSSLHASLVHAVISWMFGRGFKVSSGLTASSVAHDVHLRDTEVQALLVARNAFQGTGCYWRSYLYLNLVLHR